MPASVPVITKVSPASGSASAWSTSMLGPVRPARRSAARPPCAHPGSAKNRATSCDTTGPTSGVSSIFAASACISGSSSPNCSASARAVDSPTCGIPSANSRRGRVVCLLLSMASMRLAAFFSPRRRSAGLPSSGLTATSFSDASSASVSEYRSAGVARRSSFTSCSISFSPSPSMSMARRPAKCMIHSARCARHLSTPPVHL